MDWRLEVSPCLQVETRTDRIDISCLEQEDSAWFQDAVDHTERPPRIEQVFQGFDCAYDIEEVFRERRVLESSVENVEHLRVGA